MLWYIEKRALNGLKGLKPVCGLVFSKSSSFLLLMVHYHVPIYPFDILMFALNGETFAVIIQPILLRVCC